jgi:hypothetical protein
MRHRMLRRRFCGKSRLIGTACNAVFGNGHHSTFSDRKLGGWTERDGLTEFFSGAFRVFSIGSENVIRVPKGGLPRRRSV